MKLTHRFANYISTEQGSARAAVVLFGIPCCSLSLWFLKDEPPLFLVLLVPAWFVGSILWGKLMWRFLFPTRPRDGQQR